MANIQEFENALKCLMRRVDPNFQQEDRSEINNTIDLTKLFGNKPVGELVSDSLFAIGIGFVGIFTIMIAIMLSETADKVMFGCFAMICLLISAYKIDKTTRHLRSSSKSADCPPAA